VLHKIPVFPGLNPFILKHLKSIAQKMSMKEKVCILSWDEVAIQSHLTYDIQKDIICGLEDWGNHRTGKFADHALVFLLRGLNSGWKMPISYNFCSKQTNTAQLIRCIKEHISEIQKPGFQIVATVCDQGSSNVAAIKELLLRTAMKRNFKNRPESKYTYSLIYMEYSFHVVLFYAVENHVDSRVDSTKKKDVPVCFKNIYFIFAQKQ